MPSKVFSHCTSTTKSTSENNFKLLHLTKSLLVFPLLLLALPSLQVVPDLLLRKQMFKKLVEVLEFGEGDAAEGN